MKNKISLAVIITSAILMQIHGVPFWMTYTGYVGIVWSLSIEGVSLWFWWQRKPVLAVMASLMLTAGPLYQLSSPVFDQIRSGSTHSVEREHVTNEIKQLENALTQYLSNSGERLGWSGRLDRTQSKLDDARMRQRELVKAQPKVGTDWRNHAIIGLQVSVLLIVLLAQIHAVILIRSGREESASKPTDKTARSIIIVQIALKKAIEKSGGNQTEWADSKGVSRSMVSRILNHQKLIEEGGATLAKSSWIKMAELLGVKKKTVDSRQGSLNI